MIKPVKYIALSLNPAVDRTMSFDVFEVGTLNRAQSTAVTAGSKGMNVARAICALGGDALSLSFSGGAAGAFLEAELAREGIPARFVETACGVRQNIKMIDAAGVGTEANERGGPVTADELAALRDMALGLAAPGAVFALCGSLPAGADEDFYAALIPELHARGAVVALDCDGGALARALPAQPDVIKPNLRELSGLVGRPLSGRDEAADAAASVAVQYGVEVLCTLGEAGALRAAPGGGRQFATAPAGVPVRGFAGAGDTFLAVYLYFTRSRGAAPADALRRASAVAAAKVATPGSLLPPADRLFDYIDGIEVTEG